MSGLIELNCENLQRSQHVTGRNAVYPDAGVSPLYSERGGHMSHCGLGSVVRTVLRNDISIVLFNGNFTARISI